MRKFLRRTLLIISITLSVWFVYAVKTALKVRTSAELACNMQFGPGNPENFSYFQIDLREQHPTEPYFSGDLFLNLGNTSGKSPIKMMITRSEGGTFGKSVVYADLQYDEINKILWMAKPTDMTFVRLAGSHMNFPFDSSAFDFNLSFVPTPIFTNILIRNLTSSFYLPCGTASVSRNPDNSYRLKFELRRNPLIVLTAVVLILAATVFLFAIVFFLKSEVLPTAIASFFFSLWSIRTILGSEMKTFPTYFDLAILSLCVLLVVSIGIRLSVRDLK